jgi:Tol biopolymer transport system component
MNSDGSARRRLSAATASDAEALPGPSFSPDGQSIVYARNPSSTRNASAVYIIGAGAGPRRLTKERFAYDPLWSPRRDLIAFRSDRDDDEGDIYVMRSDGSDQRRLTRNRDDVESFGWSPDGRFLVYAFYDGPIYRVPASGGARRLLASFAAPEPDLAWSPDGRYIAFVSEETGDGDVHVMTAKGFKERRLTKGFFNSNPSWSPDSQQIAFAYFTRLEGPSRGGIAVIRRDGGEHREVSDGADAYPAWQPTE